MSQRPDNVRTIESSAGANPAVCHYTFMNQDFPETHKQGHVSLENKEMIEQMNLHDCDFGVQISHDGRVWVCINGIAFIRFKPDRTTNNDS